MEVQNLDRIHAYWNEVEQYLTNKITMKNNHPHLKFFKEETTNNWQWHITAANGNIICKSSESYQTKIHVIDGFISSLKGMIRLVFTNSYLIDDNIKSLVEEIKNTVAKSSIHSDEIYINI